jgi:hypothetical protein
MIDVNYQKRKNPDLFKSLEKPEVMNLSKIQNYIPIYDRFFALNNTNYNSVNLNHTWYVSDIKEIARLELEARRLPFILRRPMPNGTFEYWRISDLMIL